MTNQEEKIELQKKVRRTKMICRFKLNICACFFYQISSIFSHFLIISYDFMKFAHTVYILPKHIQT